MSDDESDDQWWDTDDGEDLEPYFLKLTNQSLTHRKRRLFLCGCCRVAAVADGNGNKSALDIAEQYADGQATDNDLSSARERADGAVVLACHSAGRSWYDNATETMRYVVDSDAADDPWKPYRDFVACSATH